VTFVFGFLDILTLKGFVPKIVLLRLGNRRTKELAEIMIQRQTAS
jgi:predicted nuclease of predicted toxin-antitoxin system